MARPKGTPNVTAEEVAEIKRLYRKGVRIADIIKQAGRSESVVYRVTRDLTRKRPPPPSGKHAKRNDDILALVENGWTRAEIGEFFGISPVQVSHVVAAHPHVVHLLRVKRLKPETVARRYRMELSTARRIADGKTTKQVKRTREDWSKRSRS